MRVPLFSIITPVRNGADTLERTVQSVLTQDRSLFEYLVQDGASTDDTVSILEAHTPHLSFVSEPDGGVYDAMNRAVARARGQYIYFIGAGDALKPGILAQTAAVIEKQTRAQTPSDAPLFLYGNVYSHSRQRVFDGRFSRTKLLRLNLCHQSVFVDRRCFDIVGPFDARFPIMADYAWNLRAFGAARIRKVYMPLVVADFAAGGMSMQGPDAAFIAARLGLIKDNLGVGLYLFSKVVSLLPPGVKEARYQAWQRVRLLLGLPVKH